MFRITTLYRFASILLLAVTLDAGLLWAQDSTPDARERFTEIDSEIQAVKQEVLDINREILQLEELLLYPREQQLVVFLSLHGDSPVRLRRVSLQLDSKLVSEHAYSQSENSALHKGGVHRIYVGRLAQGAHVLEVALDSAISGGGQFNGQRSVKLVKGSDRKIMEISVSAGSHGSQPELLIREW